MGPTGRLTGRGLRPRLRVEYFFNGRNPIEVRWSIMQDPDGKTPGSPRPPFPLWRPRSWRGFFFGLRAIGSMRHLPR
jgi:hypothetical protein